MSFQPNSVCIIPGKTKNITKTADRLMQYVLLKRSLKTFAESRSILLYFPVCYKIPLAVLLQKILYILVSFIKIYLQTQYG